MFAAIVPGDAEQVVARAAQEQGIVPLVMGAYAHSPLRMDIRNTEAALDRVAEGSYGQCCRRCDKPTEEPLPASANGCFVPP